MKSIIAGICLSMSAIAQAQSSAWSMTTVESDDNNVAGYIYHTYSRGTATFSNSPNKYVSGLRFICSTKKPGADPVLAIFWNGTLTAADEQAITITVDKKTVVTDKWFHDGQILFLTASVANPLIAAMKNGRAVNFSWTSQYASYVTAFDLKDFNLQEFNTACKTNL
jgi:hypothetical protein